MSKDERGPEWDWVKATHECNAADMFYGTLQRLAERNVKTRNQQINAEKFMVTPDGGRFSVLLAGAGPHEVVDFRLAGDAAEEIVVTDAKTKKSATYTVGLDNAGVCKLKRGDDDFYPWQVLKLHLQHLLFR